MITQKTMTEIEFKMLFKKMGGFYAIERKPLRGPAKILYQPVLKPGFRRLTEEEFKKAMCDKNTKIIPIT